jgi:hypothetical protein
MSQVLGAFGLPDFTILRPILVWRAFGNLGTIYLIFSACGKPRKTEPANTESVDTGAHLYAVVPKSGLQSILRIPDMLTYSTGPPSGK